MTKVNRIGKIYGKLLVIREGEKSSSNKITWVCKCACGKKTIVCGDNLQTGNSTSCKSCAMSLRVVSEETREKRRQNLLRDYTRMNNP